MEGRTEGMDTFTPRVQSSPLGATFTPGDHLSPLGAKLNPTWGLRVEPTKCPLPTLKTARNSKNKESSFNGALGCTFWTNRPPKGSFYDNRWFFVEASFFSLFPIQWMKISGGERNGWNPFKKMSTKCSTNKHRQKTIWNGEIETAMKTGAYPTTFEFPTAAVKRLDSLEFYEMYQLNESLCMTVFIIRGIA
jgi:hypothetical protein